MTPTELDRLRKRFSAGISVPRREFHRMRPTDRQKIRELDNVLGGGLNSSFFDQNKPLPFQAQANAMPPVNFDQFRPKPPVPYQKEGTSRFMPDPFGGQVHVDAHPNSPAMQAMPMPPKVDPRRDALPRSAKPRPTVGDTLAAPSIEAQNLARARQAMPGAQSVHKYNQAQKKIEASEPSRRAARQVARSHGLPKEAQMSTQNFLAEKEKQAKDTGMKAEWWALLAAGFATMAAPDGSSAAQALGQGGLAGMQAYDQYKKDQRIKAREKLEEAITIAQLAGTMTGTEEYLKAFKEGDEKGMAEAIKNMAPRSKPRTETGDEVLATRLQQAKLMQSQHEPDSAEYKHIQSVLIDPLLEVISSRDFFEKMLDNPNFDFNLNPTTPSSDTTSSEAADKIQAAREAASIY